ncbi:MAG: hypothetical protein AAF990_25450 [Bacteroidota bacterium]
MATILLIVHLLSSLYMFGLIWFVQVVHYPLMAEIEPTNFISYERQHTLRTGWVVAPVMLAELGSGVGLLLTPIWAGLGFQLLIVSLAALAGVWLSTFLIQVPLHQSLSQAYDRHKIKRLVNTNWIRTFLWSLRAAIVVYLVVVL